MRIQRNTGTVSVTGFRELTAANARSFRMEVGAALGPDVNVIEIDLAQTSFVDSSGLGALVALLKSAQRNTRKEIAMRLLHPQPPVQQLFELTRIHQLFEIIPTPATAGSCAAPGSPP